MGPLLPPEFADDYPGMNQYDQVSSNIALVRGTMVCSRDVQLHLLYLDLFHPNLAVVRT